MDRFVPIYLKLFFFDSIIIVDHSVLSVFKNQTISIILYKMIDFSYIYPNITSSIHLNHLINAILIIIND